MDNLHRLGRRVSIPIQPDEKGFTGRECPNSECEGYFKIECGTGLKGENLPCYCPYCGHTASHDEFWTKEQIEYAKSVAFQKITTAFHKDLKKLEFDYKPRGTFGIGLSFRLSLGGYPQFVTTEKKGSKQKSSVTHALCATQFMGFLPFARIAGYTIHFRFSVRTWNWLPKCWI